VEPSEWLYFFMRDVQGVRRRPRVTEHELLELRQYLADPPGGLAESPAAAAALRVLDQALAETSEAKQRVLSDVEADAIYWALERIMADNRKLSAGCTNCAM
jgi:hypothetical protein